MGVEGVNGVRLDLVDSGATDFQLVAYRLASLLKVLALGEPLLDPLIVITANSFSDGVERRRISAPRRRYGASRW